MIITSVPGDILNQLPPSAEPTPYSLPASIEGYLEMSSPSDHKSLRIEAETTFFEPGMTLSEYLLKHKTIRAKLITAKYPGIGDETTTVEFLIDGLRKNPATVEFGRMLLGMNPPEHQGVCHHVQPTVLLQFKFRQVTICPLSPRRYAYVYSRPKSHQCATRHPKSLLLSSKLYATIPSDAYGRRMSRPTPPQIPTPQTPTKR